MTAWNEQTVGATASLPVPIAGCAALECFHCVEHLAAELDDGQVAGTQPVVAAVGDRPPS
jgi:hypothetical protein